MMKKIITVFTITLTALFWRGVGGEAFAQNPLIDSLQTELSKAKEDTTKVNLFNELSKKTLNIGNYDNAISYANNAMKLAEKLKYKKGEARAYSHIGIVYASQGNYPQALENHFASLKINEEIGNKKGIAGNYGNIGLVYANQGNYPEALKNHLAALKIDEATGDKSNIARNYGNIGGVYYYQGNYPKALENFLAALKINQEIGNKSGIASNYGNIGNVYYSQGNNPKALENHLAALKIDEATGNKRGIASNYGNIGIVYANQGNYPEALKNFFAALKINEEIGNKYAIALNYNNIGGVYFYQGNYPKALENYLAALKINQEIGNKSGIAGNYNNIGRVYMKMGDVYKGKEWLQKGLPLSKEIGKKETIKASYNGLATADSTLGNFKEAYENYKMYIVYKDSLFNEENTKKLTQTQMQYEFDKKEAATKAEQEKKDIRQRNIRNSSFAAVGALLLFSLVVVRQRNKVKREKENVEKEKQRSEELLLNILPEEVAEELKAKGSAEAKQFDEVSILFTDFVQFTHTSEQLTPQQLVQELNECFTAFDKIIERNGLEKIKTIGDAYMAVCGLPVSDPRHAQKTVKAALEIRDFIEERRKQERTFEIRIGINSGSVVAGIVGIKKFTYDIWGDTVNTASRMESNGQPGKVNISETTYQLVKDDFECTYRGKINAKGKGEMDMYFVENKKNDNFVNN